MQPKKNSSLLLFLGLGILQKQIFSFQTQVTLYGCLTFWIFNMKNNKLLLPFIYKLELYPLQSEVDPHHCHLQNIQHLTWLCSLYYQVFDCIWMCISNTTPETYNQTLAPSNAEGLTEMIEGCRRTQSLFWSLANSALMSSISRFTALNCDSVSFSCSMIFRIFSWCFLDLLISCFLWLIFFFLFNRSSSSSAVVIFTV